MNTQKKFTYFFGNKMTEGDPKRKDILGGKGASLAAMSQAGLPVPPGFTISAECCQPYLQSGGKWPDGLEDEVRMQMKRLEEVTGRKFGDMKNPLLVSVRSGAAVSMPGMMDTILNCGLIPDHEFANSCADPIGFWKVYQQFVIMFARTVSGISASEFDALDSQISPVTADDYKKLIDKYLELYEKQTNKPFPVKPWDSLKECIDAVFNSWNTERAITYRKEHDIRGLLGTAVNVQAMFPSEISGIVFTTNPNDVDADEMIIEASYGLGEAVVSGDVQPDKFIVDRKTLKLKRSTIGHKVAVVSALGKVKGRDPDSQSLTETQIKEIAEISMQVEKFYGVPMDIEWGWADGKFALLQSRPIRGLEILRDVEEGRREEIARLKQLSAGKRRVWIRHNLHEILPNPTPLTWDIVRDFMKGNGGFGKMYKDFGYKPSQTVCEEGFLELICGVIYADPERAAELFWESIPLQYNIDELSRNPKLMDSAPTEFVPERVDGKVLKSLPRFLKDTIKCSRNMKKWRQYVVERFNDEIVPVFLEWVKKKHEQDLTKLSTSEVLEELNERIEFGLNRIGAETLKPGFFGGMAQANLEATLTRIMGEMPGRQLAMVLTQGLEGDTTIEQNMMLYRLSRGEISKKDFITKYGHRAIGEMELSRPRWREDDTYIRQVVENMLGTNIQSPEELHNINMERRLEAERKLPDTLKEWGANCLLEEIIKEMRDAQKMLPYREIGKDYLMMGYETIRLAIMELARRWEIGKDIFFLHLSELPLYEKNLSEFAPKIQARKIRWQAFKRLEMPDVVDTADIENLGLPRKYEHATELKGDAVASGVATGQAQIIFDPQEAAPGCVDYILVCPSTDPSWTALFVHAKGLVVEQGGMLSHGAIVARDFGIPAVVCPGATKRIPKGAIVRVDGNKGLITILEGTAKE